MVLQKTFFFSLFLFLISIAHAEYRVFHLIIYSDSEKQVLSNLDPEQYVRYYPILSGEKIKYIDTWICKGRTNGKDYCPNPRLKTEVLEQDSLNKK